MRIETVPDDVADVAASVAALSARVGPQGYVFSFGGIGPTHDDITYEAVASAFGLPLEVHQETLTKMTAHYAAQGKDVNAARKRMATLPSGSIVHSTPGSWVPLAQVRNVFVLPGIPWLMKSMLEANRHLFYGPSAHSAALYTLQGEGELAEALGKVAAAFPTVTIGSYPNTIRGDARFTAKLCFDSRDEEALAKAVAATREVIPTFDVVGE